MTKTLGLLVLAVALLGGYGCASTMESANKGAETVGETGGRVLRVPNSLSEGAAGGIAGEPEKNPYGR